jgi:hypothetical protein
MKLVHSVQSESRPQAQPSSERGPQFLFDRPPGELPTRPFKIHRLGPSLVFKHLPYAANISTSPPWDSGCGMRSRSVFLTAQIFLSYQSLRSDGETTEADAKMAEAEWKRVTHEGSPQLAPCRQSISGRRELVSSTFDSLYHSCRSESVGIICFNDRWLMQRGSKRMGRRG